MNITENLLKRINNRLTETKAPCKLYATESAANKAGLKVATKAANHFAPNGEQDTKPANYLVLFIPAISKWTACVDMNQLLSRPNRQGGYAGICGDFYTY